MIITSTMNNKIKEIKKLKENKIMNDEKMFLVEGEHLVLEAYKSNVLKSVIKLENNTSNYNVDEIIVSSNVMKSISDMSSTPSVIGICKFKLESDKLGDKIIVLDDVQDPGNLGTIIRSAVAFGYSSIILSNSSVKMYNSKVIRASQGMLFKLNIINRDLLDVLPKLKEEGYKIYATDVVSGINLKDVKASYKHAIILGNEGNGVSDKVKALADQNIYIKMKDTCESLNVAVASSIIMYELGE